MMNTKYLWGVLFVTLLSAAVESKRVNIKSAPADAEDDAAASAADDQPVQFKPLLVARRPLRPLQQHSDADAERQPVVVIRQSPRTLAPRPQPQQLDEEDQDAAQQQQPQDNIVIRQRPRAQVPPQQQLVQQRFKEPQQQPSAQQQKEPTAQTIRNYNKLNDDGSFTFGYEADDGSFKEETRGTDCVVRGKYGYVDPDGNKREFSYVQGNPCDPNAPAEDDDDQQPQRPGGDKPDEEENVPANVPRPRPAAPKKNRPTTTLFQQTFGDFEQPQQQPSPVPSTTPRQPSGRQEQLQRRPPQISPLHQTDSRLTSTASPSPLPSSTPSFRPSIAAADDLESAIRNLPQPTAGGKLLQPSGPNSPLYTTELVFDPATGQYNTVVFQQVPKQSAGINISQRLPLAPARQPQPQFQPHSPPQFQPQPQPQPQFRPALQPFSQPQFQPHRPVEFDFQRPAAFPPASPIGPQQQFLQQQQALTFQQSQNLFRQQQQKQQQQQQQQPFQPQSAQFFPPPSQRFVGAEQPQFAPPKQQRFEPQTDAQQQQFVLVQPGRTPGQQNLAAGQIDAFLRGHNVQF